MKNAGDLRSHELASELQHVSIIPTSFAMTETLIYSKLSPFSLYDIAQCGVWEHECFTLKAMFFRGLLTISLENTSRHCELKCPGLLRSLSPHYFLSKSVEYNICLVSYPILSIFDPKHCVAPSSQ